MRAILLVLAAGLIASTAFAGGPVLCAKRSKAVTLRTDCRRGETKIDVAQMANEGTSGRELTLPVLQVAVSEYVPVPTGAPAGIAGAGPIPGTYLGVIKAVVKATGSAPTTVVCHMDGQAQPDVDTASVLVLPGSSATIAMVGKFQVLSTLGIGGTFGLRCSADGGAEIGDIKLLAIDLKVASATP